jgi:hypothetical protein
MMEAVSTSETSVNFYVTIRRNIPKDGSLQVLSRFIPGEVRVGTSAVTLHPFSVAVSLLKSAS